MLVMCRKDLIPLNLLIMLANQLLRFRKQHLFQLRQFLPDGSKCHFYLKKESLLNVYLMHWTFIPPKIQTNLYTSTKNGRLF